MAPTAVDRWEDLFREIGEIKTSIAVMVSKQIACEGQINTNTRTLWGNNGDIGVVAEVDALKKWRTATTAVGVAILIAVLGDIVLRVVAKVY
jgi:ABC-type taurine transport system ATPase subunit